MNPSPPAPERAHHRGHHRRIDRLRERLPELGAAAFLVTNVVNVRYLTGFSSSNAALLVDAERAILVTDGRYIDAARQVAGVETVEAARELADDLGSRLDRLTSGPVAFEADCVTVTQHRKLAKSRVELVPVEGVVEALRAVKDESELDAIRRATAITVDVFERLAAEPLVARSEAEVAWWVERLLRDLGGEAIAFDAIVASGPNAALPHHHPGARTIGRGETVIVDAGCVIDGYRSDCTRTFATGALPAELEQAYQVCREAQAASLAAVRPGAACREVDAIARRTITEAGYEVLHNLGHSVGLEVHEEPRLAKTSDATLEAGNVITVEPGVYLAGLGGARIEDLVVVTDDGPEVLTRLPNELVRLDGHR